jgi:hypothetical protein
VVLVAAIVHQVRERRENTATPRPSVRVTAVLVVLKANHRGRRAGGWRPISRRRRANRSGETPLSMEHGLTYLDKPQPK